MSFRAETRAWLEENCPASCRGPGEAPGGGTKAPMTGDERAWLERAAERGYTVPTWPAEYGGGGLSQDENLILLEEMRRIGARAPVAGMGTFMLGPTLLEHGTEEQKKRHIPRIARGRGVVVPGLLRTEFRVGPREPAHPRRGQGRPLPRQRPEDLDLRRAVRGLDFLPRAHGPRRAETSRDQLPALLNEPTRRHGEADPADLGRVALLRDVFRQRGRAEGRLGRRAEPGLDNRQTATPARTRRHPIVGLGAHAGERSRPAGHGAGLRRRARRPNRGPDAAPRHCPASDGLRSLRPNPAAGRAGGPIRQHPRRRRPRSSSTAARTSASGTASCRCRCSARAPATPASTRTRWRGRSSALGWPARRVPSPGAATRCNSTSSRSGCWGCRTSPRLNPAAAPSASPCRSAPGSGWSRLRPGFDPPSARRVQCCSSGRLP